MGKVKATYFKGQIKRSANEILVRRANKKNEKDEKKEAGFKELQAARRSSKNSGRSNKRAATPALDSRAFEIDDDIVDYSGVHDDEDERENETTPAPAADKKRTINDVWKKYGKTLVEWYVEAMAMGEPHMLSVNFKQDRQVCTCKLLTKEVTLYTMGCRF